MLSLHKTTKLWQFAKLENNVFVQDEISYSLSSEPHKIAGILNHIFTIVVKGAEEYLTKNPEKNKLTWV